MSEPCRFVSELEYSQVYNQKTNFTVYGNIFLEILLDMNIYQSRCAIVMFEKLTEQGDLIVDDMVKQMWRHWKNILT